MHVSLGLEGPSRGLLEHHGSLAHSHHSPPLEKDLPQILGENVNDRKNIAHLPPGSKTIVDTQMELHVGARIREQCED